MIDDEAGYNMPSFIPTCADIVLLEVVISIHCIIYSETRGGRVTLAVRFFFPFFFRLFLSVFPF
jgi:hypothetical protein